MADDEDADADLARSRLLGLLEGEEWKFSERALREGKTALRWLHDREPTECEMVAYVVGVLKTDAVVRCAPQGDPPGSTGIAWQFTDQRSVFFKLQLRGGFGGESRDEYAYIQSIHQSIHFK